MIVKQIEFLAKISILRSPEPKRVVKNCLPVLCSCHCVHPKARRLGYWADSVKFFTKPVL